MLLRMILPLVRRLGRAPLAEALGRREAERVLREVASGRHRRSERVAQESSVTGRLMVGLAEVTADLDAALRRRGLSEREARELVTRTTWSIYGRMGRVAAWLARLGGRSGEGRLRRAIALFRRWPFGPPAYEMRDVDAGAGVVAFDVVRCPVAEAFRRRGQVELCKASWCDLDYPLARDWGARLERSTTLVEGAERCDFRWRALGGE